MNATDADHGRKPWHEPYCFYGTVWSAPARKTLDDYVRTGLLDVRAAGLLAVLARASVSMVVVSPRARAGKSTLLRTLLDHVPGDVELIFLRGTHEPFAFHEAPLFAVSKRLLVANEISPHLPVYLWGEAARQALTLSAQPGYALWATAHAGSRSDLFDQWSKPPIGFEIPSRTPWPVVVSLGDVGVIGASPHCREVEIEIGDLRLDARRWAVTFAPDMRGHFSGIDALCHAVWAQLGSALRSEYMDQRHLACALGEATGRLLVPAADDSVPEHGPLSTFVSRTA